MLWDLKILSTNWSYVLSNVFTLTIKKSVPWSTCKFVGTRPFYNTDAYAFETELMVLSLKATSMQILKSCQLFYKVHLKPLFTLNMTP